MNPLREADLEDLVASLPLVSGTLRRHQTRATSGGPVRRVDSVGVDEEAESDLSDFIPPPPTTQTAAAAVEVSASAEGQATPAMTLGQNLRFTTLGRHNSRLTRAHEQADPNASHGPGNPGGREEGQTFILTHTPSHTHTNIYASPGNLPHPPPHAPGCAADERPEARLAGATTSFHPVASDGMGIEVVPFPDGSVSLRLQQGTRTGGVERHPTRSEQRRTLQVAQEEERLREEMRSLSDITTPQGGPREMTPMGSTLLPRPPPGRLWTVGAGRIPTPHPRLAPSHARAVGCRGC